jgi:protein-disulfide isomerase
MRFLFAAIAMTIALLPSATGDALAGQARDWRTTVAPLPDGGYRIGDPAAPVKLVEYVSYTCPACGYFVRDSKAVLMDDMVRRGRVSVELRQTVRDGLDLTAAMLVRCTAPANLYPAHQAVFDAQATILEKAGSFKPAEGAAPEAQMAAVARHTGLTTLLQPRLARPVAACLSNAGDRDRLVAQTQAAFQKISGTPSFEINGKPATGHDWASLEPQLRAAGAN